MTLAYEIQVNSEALRGLNRLPAKVAAAVIEFIAVTLAENPQQLSKPLRANLDRYRSARRGDYRILIRIDEDNRLVLIIRIDHRAHVYRLL